MTKKLDLFGVINNISQSKENIWDEIEEAGAYNSFMVNKGLSYHLDCVLFANEMNRHYNIPDRYQYEFLHVGIEPKKKRFAKWESSKKDAEVLLVSEFYGCNLTKAAGYRSLMSDEQLEEIKQKLDKGGR